jgi:hypothetical protein
MTHGFNGIRNGWRASADPLARVSTSEPKPTPSVGTRRQRLHQAVQILMPVVKGLDGNSLIATVHPNVGNVVREPGMAVGRNAGVA